MGIEIKFASDVNSETSNTLKEVSKILLNDHDIQSKEIPIAPKIGEKSTGLVELVQVAGVTVAAINGIIGVMRYIQAKKPTISVELQTDGKKYVVSGNTSKELSKAIERIESEITSEKQIIFLLE